MDTLIADLDGVGEQTLKVFRKAGLHKVADVYSFGTQEDAVRQAAYAMAVENGMTDSDSWRALATRCVTVIKRVRSAEATPFCPEHFLCPITYMCMEDPYVTKYGDSFEKWAIERVIHERGVDPMSQRPLALCDIFPNKALKDAIDFYNAHFMRFSIPFRVT